VLDVRQLFLGQTAEVGEGVELLFAEVVRFGIHHQQRPHPVPIRCSQWVGGQRPDAVGPDDQWVVHEPRVVSRVRHRHGLVALDGQLGERGLARYPVDRGTDLRLHPGPGFIDEGQQRVRHAEQAHRGPGNAVEALLPGSIENLERIKRFQSLRLGARHEIPARSAAGGFMHIPCFSNP